MDCPHCSKSIHEAWEDLNVLYRGKWSSVLSGAGEPDVTIKLVTMTCPACDKRIVLIRRSSKVPQQRARVESRIVYPLNVAERSAPPEVPEPLRGDYSEATAILNLSPQASAALSRRIVQQVLKDKGNYSEGNLSDQIQTFVDDPRNPSELKGNIDYLREIGNFAAHPMKSTSSGAVLQVEPVEAEWAIEVVDGLFDFYFVGPAQDARRRRDFDGRIADAGRRSAIGGEAG